ncbi:MAG: cation diffusion facilitator family transporter [Maricaulaceae bacterium]
MPHDAALSDSPGRIPPQQAVDAAKAATRASAGVALGLTAVKIVAVLWSDSIGLLASLADSGLDLFGSLAAFVAVRHAALPADAEHRYGHGKAEAFASLAQAGLVLASAVFVSVRAVDRLANPEPISAPAPALAVMAISITATLWLVRMQTRAIQDSGSLAVRGDRLHYLADLGANAAVMVGIALHWLFHWGWADALVGLGVALGLSGGAKGLVKAAWDQLIDRELAIGEREQIQALAEAAPQVLGVHDLRTRASGPFAHLQFHIDLDPNLDLRSVHEIILDVEARVLDAFPGADVLIHPDPKGAAPAHGNPHFGGERDGHGFVA